VALGGGLWADLILGLGDRIGHDLALTLVLGLDGPHELGGHEDDEPDSLYVARELAADGRAAWHPLLPVGRDELRRFTGPASSDVLTSLLRITGGEPVWTGALWRQWQRDGVVDDRPESGWRFTSGGREAMLDEVDAPRPGITSSTRGARECAGQPTLRHADGCCRPTVPRTSSRISRAPRQ
jgi:hypothetical protein